MTESSIARDDRRVTTDERDLRSFLIRSRFDDPAERRAHARGELVRVAPGRYVESTTWRGLRREERHALRTVAAVGRMRHEVVVSHTSAAAVWGMPVLGPPLARVSTTDPARARTHTGAHVTRHAARLPAEQITRHRGLVLTTPARTAVDVALTGTRSQAVAVLDHCLRHRLCTLAEYQSCLLGRDRVRGSTRASWVAEFASPLAGSAGESVYRVALDGLGFPAPRLQERHVDDEGLIGFTDFGWEAYGVYDEFDGFVKYLDREMRHGLTADEIVVLEKVREDRLRALPYVKRVTRTIWRDLARPQRIVTRLERAGVPRVHTANRARRRD